MADYGNPFQGMLNPNLARGANLWDLRMMSAANRMETPFERMAGGHTRSAIASNPMLSGLVGNVNEPDLSQFTFNPTLRAEAQKLGVQPLEASQVRQNMILPNTGFFGSHPRLSRALEAGMFGTMAAHGGNTVGESIQGTMEGVLGGQRLREGLYREQFAKPFEAAGIVEGLKDQVQRRQLQEADIQHLRALNEHLENGDDLKAQQLMETNRHNEAVEAMRDRDVTERNRHDEAMEANARLKEQNALLRRQQNQAGMMKGIMPDPTGKTGGRYMEIAPGQPLPPGFQPMQGTYAEKRGDKAADARQKWIEKQLATPGPVWMAAGVAPGDKQASKKLGDFYDSNIVSEAPSSQVVPFE